MNVHGSTSIARAKGVFINNAWSDASSGQSLPVIAPAEGRQFAEIAAGDAIDVDRAVKAARAAVEGAWGRLSATERGRLLTNLGYAIADHADELTRTRSARHGQADEAGPRRHRCGCAIFRILRRRGRQSAWRYHPVPARLLRHDRTCPTWRGRPHHPVELSGANVRTHAGAGTGDGQRVRRQAR